MKGVIVFGILARDCAENMRRNIKRVEKAGGCFDDYRVLVYENDSKDGTDALVREWQESNPRVTGICETIGERTIPKSTIKCPYPAKSAYRIERMAAFRNRVLDEVRQRFSPDYFCFIDIDIVDFDPASLAKAIEEAPEGWGGLFASGHVVLSDGTNSIVSPFQYDSYAFLHDGVVPEETGGWVVNRHFHELSAYVLDQGIRNTAYYPCTSAFNGIGIYRWEAINGLRYRVLQTPELRAVNACFCEHVPFNADVRDRGYGLYAVRSMEVVCLRKKMTMLRRYQLWKSGVRTAIRINLRGLYPFYKPSR